MRAFLVASAALSLLMAAAAVYGFAAYRLESNEGTKGCFYGGPGCPQPPGREVGPCASDVCNYLLLGSDSRTGLDPAQIDRFGTDRQAGAGRNADVIMLVHIDPKLEKAIVLSFPRDLWVKIPEHGEGRINASFGLGGGIGDDGPRLVARTIHGLTGLTTNHYLYVDLNGFEQVVESLGGVDMCIPAENADPATGRIVDPKTLLNIAPGCQRLDALQALAYVRARSLRCDLAAPDLYRIGRQQQFLRALLNRLLRPEELIRAQSLVGPVLASLRRDQELKIADLVYLVGRLKGIGTDTVEFRSVPASAATIDGKDVLKIDPSAERIFEAIREGRSLGTLGVTPDQTPPSPANITVPVVDRGSGATAPAAERILIDSGFDVSPGIVPFDRYGATVSGSWIAYAPDYSIEAKVVQQYLPGLKLQEVEGLRDHVAVFVTESITAADIGAPGGSTPSDCLGPAG